ncbi:hypothetical protein JS609_01258 [Bacillus subtilis]|uniref:hypothetical protein n=1 Tax=Bacillus subtilis TaxID=1423 RepID=UPI001B92D40A|nr:hypothetical protein [Bacillus subtilis]UBZ18156.1 hypothetical protein JS609_01258 [Bacillus subtilis]WAE49593.1 hypothetical protein ORP33_06305 [Bacillus subtilis]CAF1792125.1 hypothetical protein NRS6128_00335 [Bacillus subtilis]CAI6249605.1 hypothetical protein NRS6128_06300 [Bacillus subtilis]
MNVSELVIFPDLLKLPKSDLEDICTNEGIAESGGAFELAKRIWDYADTSEKKTKNVYTVLSQIFCW